MIAPITIHFAQYKNRYQKKQKKAQNRKKKQKTIFIFFSNCQRTIQTLSS